MLHKDLSLVLISPIIDPLESEYKMPQIYHSTASRNPLSFETKRVQSNGQSFMIVFPKVFADHLGLERRGLTRFYRHNSNARKIIVEKISTEEFPPLFESGDVRGNIQGV
jgi:hypothetical protein